MIDAGDGRCNMEDGILHITFYISHHGVQKSSGPNLLMFLIIRYCLCLM